MCDSPQRTAIAAADGEVHDELVFSHDDEEDQCIKIQIGLPLRRGIVSGMSTTRDTLIRWTTAGIFESSILDLLIESHLSVQNDPFARMVFWPTCVGVVGSNHTF